MRIKSLAKVIDKEDSFNFNHYTYTPQEILKAQHLEEDSRAISLMPQETVHVKFQTLLGILAPSLLSSKLESVESVVINNPQ